VEGLWSESAATIYHRSRLRSSSGSGNQGAEAKIIRLQHNNIAGSPASRPARSATGT